MTWKKVEIPKKIWHIVIEGHDEEEIRELFEQIQNRYSLYDNCVMEEHEPEDTIIDADRYDECGDLTIDKDIVKKHGESYAVDSNEKREEI
jgi:hypothetical protein